MNVRSLIFILLCFAGHLCYGLSNNAVERVINGEDTDISSAPYMLSIRIKDRHVFGAAIINQKWAVTSGLSMKMLPEDYSKDVTVCSGSSILTNCTVHKIVVYTIHEKYNYNTSDYDIAVFQVTPEFSFNNRTKAVHLASNWISRKWGKICGWGEYQKSNGEIQYVASKNLKCVKQQRMDDCEEIYGDKITPRMICYWYRKGDKGPCYGDSGGPIISEDNILIGIYMFFLNCAEKYKPDIYTDAICLKDWIKNNTRINA